VTKSFGTSRKRNPSNPIPPLGESNFMSERCQAIAIDGNKQCLRKKDLTRVRICTDSGQFDIGQVPLYVVVSLCPKHFVMKHDSNSNRYENDED
jgi:hypothetical protein